MLTFDQIAEEARSYANLTSEETGNMETAVLHEQLSLRVAAQEDVTSSKKLLVGSANDVLKRIRGDIFCLNQEIRRRLAAEKARRDSDVDIAIEALSEPENLQIVG